MLLIAAAMQEELNPALDLCRDLRRLRECKASIWEAACGPEKIFFLKTGVGPVRSAARLEYALEFLRPSRVLVTGYAGALDPGIRLGTVVIVRKALACTLGPDCPSWEYAKVDEGLELADSEALAAAAKSAGLTVVSGNVLTSAHVLGIPEHKRLLYQTFHASIVDMETAALARVAQTRNVALSCMRAISDEAEDAFLAPFSYDPAVGIPARALQLIGTGSQIYRKWKENSATASEALSRVFVHFLQDSCIRGAELG